MRIVHLVIPLVAVAASARAQVAAYEGAISFSRGEFVFTQPTSTWGLVSGFSVRTGPVSMRISIPVVLQNTRLVSSTGSGMTPTGGPFSGEVADAQRVRRRGAADGPQREPVSVPTEAVGDATWYLGDPVGQFGVDIFPREPLQIQIGLAAKAPVSDTSGLGTGTWDAGASLSASYRTGAATLLGVTASYWHLGNLGDLELENVLGTAVDVSTLLSNGWAGQIGTAYQSPVLDGFSAAISSTVGVTRMSTRHAVGMVVGVGWTETSPGFSLSLLWRLGLADSST